MLNLSRIFGYRSGELIRTPWIPKTDLQYSDLIVATTMFAILLAEKSLINKPIKVSNENIPAPWKKTGSSNTFEH